MSRFVALASLTFFVVAACGKASAAPVFVLAAPSSSPSPPSPVVLPIAAREHAHEAPPEGWCGETAIQEGLLHLGVWAPQRVINRAGKPVHPDLYSTDIPVALTELGVRFTSYPGGRGFAPIAAWIRGAVDAGDPVLAGVKILPTKHPEWGLDHFVLVVGYDADRLLVNTTWGHRAWVADTTTPGLSFANAGYALRLSGVTLAPGARAAKLVVLEEDDTTVKVRATCTGLEKGQNYVMERRTSRASTTPSWAEEMNQGSRLSGSHITPMSIR